MPDSPYRHDIEVLYAFLANKDQPGPDTATAGSLKADFKTKQLFFMPTSNKRTAILLAEWVGRVLLIRNWKRDRGTYGTISTGRKTTSYSMADYAGSILYFLDSKPAYQGTHYLEVAGVIQQIHRDEARLLNSSLML